MNRLFSREEESAWWTLKQTSDGTSFYHLYTKPTENAVIITNKSDLCLAITYMALAAVEAGITILGYAVMNNHFHWIVRGASSAVDRFFNRFKQLMDVYLCRHGRGSVIRSVTADRTEITSLKQFRDELAYVLRNPFVVRNDINILSNEWTSGFLYFNPFAAMLPFRKACSLTKMEKRRLLKSSTLSIPGSLTVLGGTVNPASFVDYKTVEALFSNARKFTAWLLRNVEAQVETALRYDESPNLPDEELGPVLWRLCMDRFGQKNFRSLIPSQKLEVYKECKYKYYASNAQLARITGTPLREIDALFPKLN